MKRILAPGGCGPIGAQFVDPQPGCDPGPEVAGLDAPTSAEKLADPHGLASESRYRFAHGDAAGRLPAVGSGAPERASEL